MLKNLLFLLCAAVAHQVAFAQIKSSSPDSLYSVLSANKKATDAYVDRQSKNILVYSKVPGKKVPQRVYNDKWPDETEFDYNVVKAKNGKIILISHRLPSKAAIGLSAINITLMNRDALTHSRK